MGRFAIALAVVAGCGRIGFDARDGSGGTGLPYDGDFTLSAPVAISAVNSQWYETECFVLPDGLTLYFASDRMFDPGAHDVYAATRPTLDGEFAGPTVLGSISSTISEGRLVTGDGYVAYYWTDDITTPGDTDIRTVSRADLAQPFAGAGALPVPGLDTARTEYDPWPTPDGRRLYYVLDDGSGALQDLWFVERADAADAFGAPQRVPVVNSAANDDNPALSGDERFLVFSSFRNGVDREIYYARRPNRDALFDAPQLLPVVNSTDQDWEPCITDRGELVFSSDRPGGMGSTDLYRAYFIPLD